MKLHKFISDNMLLLEKYCFYLRSVLKNAWSLTPTNILLATISQSKCDKNVTISKCIMVFFGARIMKLYKYVGPSWDKVMFNNQSEELWMG